MYQAVDKHSLCVLILLLAQPCFALPDDNKKIMDLHASTADFDYLSHHGLYMGNVQLDQGSTHIRAAMAVTEGNSKNQLVKATIKGNKEEQAHYWTLTATDKPPLHAYADTITYYPEKNIIELVGNAKVTQGNDAFSAPLINYDTVHQHIISKHDGKTRTTIIIHPGKPHE